MVHRSNNKFTTSNSPTPFAPGHSAGAPAVGGPPLFGNNTVSNPTAPVTQADLQRVQAEISAYLERAKQEVNSAIEAKNRQPPSPY